MEESARAEPTKGMGFNRVLILSEQAQRKVSKGREAEVFVLISLMGNEIERIQVLQYVPGANEEVFFE